MEQFRKIISAVLEGRISVEQAQQGLAKLVEREPQLAQEFVGLLNRLYSERRLDPQRYSMLRTSIVSPQTIAQSPTAGPTGSAPSNDAASPPGAASTGPSATDSSTGDQTGSDRDAGSDTDHESAQDPSQEDGAKTRFRMPESGPSQDSDKTAFRPNTPPGGSGQNGTPTSGGSPTGATSGTLGGTGSNWSSPSAWTGAGGGESTPVNVGSIIKDRFVLEELIGRGGMGLVFKARDLRKEEAQDRNPYVALKVLNEEFKQHPDSLKALQREARKAQQLTHPNIVNVHDFDRDGSNVFMNMELLEGVPLDKLIRKNKGQGMRWEDALPLIQGMSLALDYAHRKNIIHSDFKPGNCFLTKDKVVKVFDFGIARAAKRTGELRGEETKFDAGTLGALTPAYATLEMIDGDEPDKRDDVYALACSIYELLAGRHPYNKLSAAEASEKGLVPKPIPGLSRARNKALARGLALTRDKRTRSAFALLEELNPKRSKQLLRVGLPAATVLVLVVAGLIFGSIYLNNKQIESIGARLSGGQFEEVEAALGDLQKLDTKDQQALLTQYRNDLTTQYENEVIRSFAPSDELYDYPRAQALLAEIEQIFPDSSRIQSLKELIEKDRQDIQVQKAGEYEAFLDAGELLPTEDEDIYDLLAIIAQVDPNDALLTDQRLPQALEQAARDAVGREDFAAAEDYLTAGFALTPDSDALINVRDALNSARNAIERAEEIARLKERLSPLTSSAAVLNDFLRGPVARDLEQLETLQPSDPVLGEVRAAAEQRASVVISELLDQRAWLEAEAQIEDLASVVSPAFADAQRNRLAEQRAAFDAQLASINADIDTVIADQTLDSTPATRASTLLSRLSSAGAPQDMIVSARDRIALGYIDSARSARSNNEWEQARQLAAKATAMNPGADVQAALSDEINKIDNQETVAVQELRAQQIDALKRRFTERLADGPITATSISSGVTILTELQKNYANDPGVTEFIERGRDEIEQRLRAQAVNLAESSEWSAAETLLRAGEQALGTSTQITQTRSRIAVLRSEQASAQLKAQIAGQEDTVRGLLDQSTLNDNWMALFNRELDALNALDPGNAFGAQARVDAANLLLADAQAQRRDSRWVRARQQLDRARELAPDLSAIAAEAAVLEAALEEYNLEAAESRRTAEVMAQRVQFERQVEARRLDGAEQTLATLKTMVDANDPFVLDEAPAALVDKRLEVAAEMAGQLQLTNAIEQLERAERFSPGDERIVGARRVYEDQKSVFAIVGSNNEQRLRQLPTILARLEQSMTNFAAFEASMQSRLRASIESLANDDRPRAEQVLDAGRQAFGDLAVNWPRREVAATRPPPVIEPTVISPETTPPPVAPQRAGAGGRACKASWAGGGRAGSRLCYDFVDASKTKGPSLVVIPAMGGGPVYAISRSEITRTDFNHYCESTEQCSPLAGNGRLPATGLSAAQMEAYAAWLGSVSGSSYALPTLQQWQHAANAGGAALSSNVNCLLFVGGSQTRGFKLESTGTGANDANAWGLRHIVGNAEEVVRQGGSYVAAGGAYSDSLNDCSVSFTRPFQGPQERTGFRVVRNVQ